MERRASRAACAVLLVPLAIWGPWTVVHDLRDASRSAGLSTAEAESSRGVDAAEASNAKLVAAAARLSSDDATFAVVYSPAEKRRESAFAREAGTAWTEYALAPRDAVSPAKAGWLILMGGRPRAQLHARASWRFGTDWLVER